MAIFHRFHLPGNHRVRENEQEFSEWLLKLGNNELQKKKSAPVAECIEIPNCCVAQGMVLDIFPDDRPPEELGVSIKILLAATSSV